MPEADIEDETIVSKANSINGGLLVLFGFVLFLIFIYLPAPGGSFGSWDFQPLLWHVISWDMQTLMCSK